MDRWPQGCMTLHSHCMNFKLFFLLCFLPFCGITLHVLQIDNFNLSLCFILAPASEQTIDMSMP